MQRPGFNYNLARFNSYEAEFWGDPKNRNFCKATKLILDITFDSDQIFKTNKIQQVFQTSWF